MGYISQDENPFQELSDVFLQKPLGPTTWNAVLNFSKTESKFEWYMKSYSHDVLFDFIAMSPQMYPAGIAKSFDLHKVLYNEVDFHLPNTMGFSVVASVKLFASSNAMVNGSVLSSSDTRSTIEFNSEFSTNIAINAKMYVEGISSEEYGYEVNTFGVVKFPAQCSLDVNSNDQSLSIKHKPSKDVYDLFQFETLPVALFPVEPYKFPSKIAKNPITKKVEIGRDYLGIGLDLHIASNQNDVRGFLSGLLEAFNETSHDQAVENNTLIDQYYAAMRGLLGYAFFNPRCKPFQFVVSVVPSPKYPTKEFHITIRKQTEIFPGWMRRTIQTELVGSGAVLRKWNLDLNRTSSFPKENDLKEFVARMMSPVTKRVAEQLENVKDHYNVSFQHTFNSTVIDDSDILNHIHHTVSMASNFSNFVIAVDSSTYTTDGSVDHDKFYLSHDKFAPWAEETYRWIRKIAQDNFYCKDED